MRAVKRQKEKGKKDNLSRLLQAGWRPVRETPMGNADETYAYSLIVLEKD